MHNFWWTCAIVAAVGVAASWLTGASSARCVEEILSFPSSGFRILNPDTGVVIGQCRYSVERLGTGAILKGENHYLNGDYDIEEAHMVIVPGRPVPRLVNFKHTFYRKDGSIEREGRAELSTGVGWCETTENGKQEIESAKFNFPSDTYAGASILIPIQDYLRRGATTTALHLHVFNCAPNPKLLEIEAKPGDETRWSGYPGELVRVKVAPDFGIWNLFLRPFIPEMSAWFAPADGWNFVGGNLERYYRGPKITLVKTR